MTTSPMRVSGGQQASIGIDNIRFGQSLPAAILLPVAWLLFASGLFAFGLSRRGRRPVCGKLPI